MTDSGGRLLTVQPLIAYGEGFVQGGDLLEAVLQCAKTELVFARRVHVTTPHHTPAHPHTRTPCWLYTCTKYKDKHARTVSQQPLHKPRCVPVPKHHHMCGATL